MRPLGIASVRDRVVQQALKIVMEPIWEADFLPCSYGFRPRRDAHQALQAMREAVRAGRTWVVDADIDSFFDRLGHDLVLDCLRERISDRRVLRLIREILSAGVRDGAVLSFPGEGAPQGGPLSPLMANVVLHRLDRAWQERYHRLGVLVRYADDLCVCSPTRERAEAALQALGELLGELGLELSSTKTQIVGASGEDGLTGRNRRHIPTHLLVAELNQFLRGWRQYYRYGNSTRCFAKLDRYVDERMALLLSKRHGRRGRGYGLKLIIGSGNRLGLERLVGTVTFARTAHAAR